MSTANLNIKTEDGYMTILASMMILALLTILGMAASRSANTEVLMTGNEIQYHRNFYRAEGATMQAADMLENAINLADNLPGWLDPGVGKLTNDSVGQYWDNTTANGDTVIPQSSAIDPTHTMFIAGREGTGVARGSSIGMGKPTVRSLGIYGRCEWEGVSTIKVGYLIAY